MKAVKEAESPPLILVNIFLFFDQLELLENQIKKTVITTEILNKAPIAKRKLRFECSWVPT